MNTDTFTQAARSVETLLKVANGNTGASPVAAQVLLSAYDSYEFTVPVADLCLLDADNYEHAQRVMSLRYHGCAPQRVVPHGEQKFQALREDWAHLKTQRVEVAA